MGGIEISSNGGGSSTPTHCHDIHLQSGSTEYSSDINSLWVESNADSEITLAGIYLDIISSVSVDSGTVSIDSQDPYNIKLIANLPAGTRTITIASECNSYDLILESKDITWTSNADKSIDIAWNNLSAGAVGHPNGIEDTVNGSGYEDGGSYLLAPANHDFELSFRIPLGSNSWNNWFGICENDVDNLSFDSSSDTNIIGMNLRHVIRGGGLWWLYPKIKYENGVSTTLSGRRNYYGDPLVNTNNREDRIIMRRIDGIITLSHAQIYLDNPSWDWESALTTFSTEYHGEAHFDMSMYRVNSTPASYVGYDKFKSYYVAE